MKKELCDRQCSLVVTMMRAAYRTQLNEGLGRSHKLLYCRTPAQIKISLPCSSLSSQMNGNKKL
ncbi:MAG: hypothetical protein SAL70_04535 [Scytonema sp. PMC 1070.18]|nr:hypothetical protein [Scytonema sp. PMC 1070.18]